MNRAIILFEAQALLPYLCNNPRLPAAPISLVGQRR
jgi:hypothetical protein